MCRNYLEKPRTTIPSHKPPDSDTDTVSKTKIPNGQPQAMYCLQCAHGFVYKLTWFPIFRNQNIFIQMFTFFMKNQKILQSLAHILTFPYDPQLS